MGQITVINPSGSEIRVDESSWPYLERLGYRHKTTEETFSEAREESREEYFEGPVQTAKAFGEGVIRGATFNLIDPDSEQARGRQEFHPVAEGVGQVAGIVGPSVLAGGSGAAGAIARLTPAGRTAVTAERVGAAATSSRLGQLAIGGTVEGVTERTGALIGSALAGDEITPEAIQRELGYGALFGFGGGVLARGAEKTAHKLLSKADEVDGALKKTAEGVVEETSLEPPRNPLYDTPQAFQYGKRIKGVVADAGANLDKRLFAASEEFETWRNLANDMNAGIPDATPAPLSKAAPLPGNKTPLAKGLQGPADAAIDVTDSQIISADPLTQQVGADQIIEEARAPLGVGLHELDPQELVDRGLYQLGKPQRPGIDRLRGALKKGIDLKPVQLIEYPDGSLEIANGRHRIQAHLEMWLPVRVEVDKAAEGAVRAENRVSFAKADDAAPAGSGTPSGGTANLKAKPKQAGTVKLQPEAKPVGSREPTVRLRPDADDAAIKADSASAGVDPNKTANLRMPTADELRAKIEAAVDPVQAADEAAKTLFKGPGVDAADFWGKEIVRRGKGIMDMLAAKTVLKEAPDLSLEAISKMSEDDIVGVTQWLDRLAKVDPETAGVVQAEMRQALGKAAPKLRGFEALDILEYHKMSQQTVERLAGSHDAGKEAVALWATLRGLDAKFADKAAKAAARKSTRKLAEESTEDAVEAAGNRLGGFKGWLVKKAGGNLGKKAAGAMVGSTVGGPVGFIAGWAITESMLKGGGGALGKTVTNAKRKALIAVAKGLNKVAVGPGRPAAIVRLSSGDRLKREDDDTKDTNEVVQRRIDEALYAAGPGRERLAEVLSPLRMRSPELAASIEADARRRAEYLAKYAPRKPGWAAMVQGPWRFSQDQIDRFAAVYSAVNDPQTVLDDFANGTLTPDAAAAFRATSPGLYNLVSQYVMENFDPAESDYKQRFYVSMLTGVPYDPTLMMTPSLQQDFAKPSPQGMSLGNSDAEMMQTDAQRSEQVA